MLINCLKHPACSVVRSIRTICQAEVQDANKQAGAAPPQMMAGHGMKKNRNLYLIAGKFNEIRMVKGKPYLRKKRYDL